MNQIFLLNRCVAVVGFLLQFLFVDLFESNDLSKIIVFNKPFRVLSQFTDTENRKHLGDYIEQPGYYAAGRLDYDSEGLMILTNHGPTQHLISSKHFLKRYLIQVEGRAQVSHLERLRQGVKVKDYWAKANEIELLLRKPSWLWKRNPPIRTRKNIPTSWLLISIDQGKNRQVRRMCAAVGLPVLRLIRTQIGKFKVDGLPPSDWQFKQI